MAIAKVPEILRVKALAPKEEKSTQAVCPKTMRHTRVSENFVPCVFLGRRGLTPDGCPVVSWDGSALSEEASGTRNKMELNNNSYIDVGSEEWDTKCPTKEVLILCNLYNVAQ